MIVPIFGSNEPLPDFKGSNLIIPCSSAGHSPFIAADLMILNIDMVKVGYYKSHTITPAVINDGLTQEADGSLVLPAEVYHSVERRMTLLVIRQGINQGCMRKFGDELAALVEKLGFSSVSILTSTLSPIHRERDSNRL